MMIAPSWNGSQTVALVSGGARGIGRGIVRALARTGACVVFGDTDRAGGEETLGLCATNRVCFREVDFAEAGAWPELLAACREAGWRPTLGVSNVGVGRRLPLEQTPQEVYAGVEAINQRSAFLMAQTLVPAMTGGGTLVFIGSIMSDFGTADCALYGMTKSALSGLARSLAVELAPRRITVNCVQPGFIALEPPVEFRKIIPPQHWTAFFAAFQRPIEAVFEQLQPLPFAGRPEDIAQAILFLASESGRFVTGSALRVDGGASLRMSVHAGLFPESMLEEARCWLARQS